MALPLWDWANAMTARAGRSTHDRTFAVFLFPRSITWLNSSRSGSRHQGTLMAAKGAGAKVLPLTTGGFRSASPSSTANFILFARGRPVVGLGTPLPAIGRGELPGRPSSARKFLEQRTRTESFKETDPYAEKRPSHATMATYAPGAFLAPTIWEDSVTNSTAILARRSWPVGCAPGGTGPGGTGHTRLERDTVERDTRNLGRTRWYGTHGGTGHTPFWSHRATAVFARDVKRMLTPVAGSAAAWDANAVCPSPE